MKTSFKLFALAVVLALLSPIAQAKMTADELIAALDAAGYRSADEFVADLQALKKARELRQVEAKLRAIEEERAKALKPVWDETTARKDAAEEPFKAAIAELIARRTALESEVKGE